MPIPESQLETWSGQGAVTSAKATHEAIRRALAADKDSLLNRQEYEVFLQGSYRNDTNTRGDSDVDVVVQLNSTFVSDKSHLSLQEQASYNQLFSAATYGWEQLRADGLKALRAYFGWAKVSEGKNSLKLRRVPGRLAADIVPCLQYRRYTRFVSAHDQSYVEGILFYTRPEQQPVINYPKPHYRNGVAKNSPGRTGGRFKPVVRVFKNARSYLVDRGALSADVAPSYFLQCLLYNAPDRLFGGSYQDSFLQILVWLASADLGAFICQNGETPLFGPTRQQWSVTNARLTVSKLIELWENWYK
jgi:hypothetical protein